MYSAVNFIGRVQLCSSHALLFVGEGEQEYRFFEHHYTAMRHGGLLVDHLKIKKRCVYEVGEK